MKNSIWDSRWLPRMAFVTLFTTAFIIALVAYWMFYPYRLVEFETPMEVINSPVRRGEVVNYRLKFCKFTDLQPVISRRLINNFTIALPSLSPQSGKGCVDLISSSTIVPAHLPAGKYKLEMSSSYQVNPLRVITIPYETEEFDVIE
ncbi:hypothetical protein KKH23_07695 [Patescibacteria group bacterium]|nr:hypothetical protein [Patescibacteria group bacterium]